MRISEARSVGAAQLLAAGIDGAARDADRILAAVLEVEPGRLRHLDDRELAEREYAALMRGIAARSERQPVAQIVGFRDFYNHRLRVTADTLDPRPETETLVETALSLPWTSVLDLGTGTGAILISLLAARTGSEGTGTDISDAALAVASQNARLIGVEPKFLRANWYDGVQGRFDLIVSNPPYIALPEMAGLDPDVLQWEPRVALTDEADGLTAYRVIAAGAAAHLVRGGYVAVEIGPTQGEAVSSLFGSEGAEVRVIADIDGRDRVILARFPA